MFLQRTVKCEKKTYIEKKYFCLQIGYTEEIKAANYHFFVQKSAQYRHKILNVCVKVCIKTRPKKSLVCSSKPPEKWLIHFFYFLISYWNRCSQSSDCWHLCLPLLEMLSREHSRELVWFG